MLAAISSFAHEAWAIAKAAPQSTMSVPQRVFSKSRPLQSASRHRDRGFGVRPQNDVCFGRMFLPCATGLAGVTWASQGIESCQGSKRFDICRFSGRCPSYLRFCTQRRGDQGCCRCVQCAGSRISSDGNSPHDSCRCSGRSGVPTGHTGKFLPLPVHSRYTADCC